MIAPIGNAHHTTNKTIIGRDITCIVAELDSGTVFKGIALHVTHHAAERAPTCRTGGDIRGHVTCVIAAYHRDIFAIDVSHHATK